MINFPVSLDNLTDPVTGDKLSSPRHSLQHQDVNGAIEALEEKVGVDDSEDENSLDYQIKHLLPSIPETNPEYYFLNGNKEFVEGIHYSNGSCQISSINDNGNGSVTLGNGDYCLSSNSSGEGIITRYSLTGGAFSLTDGVVNYIVADYNGGSPLIKVITDVNLINETTVIPVYSIFRNGTYLHIQNWDALSVALSNKIHQSIIKTQRYRRESGLALGVAGTRNITVSQGRVWVGAVPIDLDAINTSTDNLFLWAHVAGVWTQSVVTQFNNTQYDNGTDLVNLTSGRYAVIWVFRGVESQKHTYCVMGTGNYTLAEAQASTVPSVPTAISSHAVLIGKIICPTGVNTPTSIQSAFDVQFSQATAQAHGDLTGRDATSSHPASSITNTPEGGISATDVQEALNELDTEKMSPSSVDTVTNKRNQPRVYSTTTLTTLTPEVEDYNIFTLTAQASGLAIANHETSTPADGEMIMIEMVCDGTARPLTFDTNYVAKAGTPLPTTLVVNKRTTLIFKWCADIEKYNLMYNGQE